MKSMNVVEAGDKVGGARNFDEKAPHHMKPLPPRGIDYAPRIRKDSDFAMEVENPNGTWKDARPVNL
jgi:hypothetical protein